MSQETPERRAAPATQALVLAPAASPSKPFGSEPGTAHPVHCVADPPKAAAPLVAGLVQHVHELEEKVIDQSEKNDTLTDMVHNTGRLLYYLMTKMKDQCIVSGSAPLGSFRFVQLGRVVRSVGLGPLS